MEKTVIIDGVEYILTPKITPTVKSEPIVETRSILDDYVVLDEVRPVLPENVPQTTPSNVKIVELVDGVEKAVARESAYRSRFLKREIRPQDISVRADFHTQDIRNFKELPEIAAVDTRTNRPPSGLGGFYGPGIERDIY